MTSRRKTAPKRGARAEGKAKKGGARPGGIVPRAADPLVRQATAHETDRIDRRLVSEILLRRLGVIVADFIPAEPITGTLPDDTARRPDIKPAELAHLTMAGDTLTATSQSAFQCIGEISGFPTIPVDSRYWIQDMLRNVGAVAIGAAVDMARVGDLTAQSTNTLSLIGDLMSWHVRRAILLCELRGTMWNLAHTAERLRLGYGTANVLRAIKDLELTSEYEAAKRDGLIKRGGRRPRVQPAK